MRSHRGRAWRAGGGCLTFAVLMAVAPAAAASPDLGVVSRLPLSDVELARMDAAGVDVLRVPLSWSRIASDSGSRFHWRRVDDTVLGAVDHGIEVIPYLDVRRWLRVAPAESARDLRRRGSNARPGLWEWKRFVSHAMSRYGTRGRVWGNRGGDVATPIAITTWEVRMGPGSSGGPAHLPGTELRGYARLLGMAGHAARRIDRGAEVAASVTVAQSRRRGPGASTLDRLVATKAGKFIDTVTVRPPARAGPRLSRGIARVRRSLDRGGLDDASIVIAPIGWSSGSRPRRRWAGRQGQADHLRRSVKRIDRSASAWGAETVIWSAWRDRPGRGCRWCRRSGLLDRTGKVKPSFRAFKRLAEQDHVAGEVPGGAFYGVTPDGELTEADILTMDESGVDVVRLVISWPGLQPGGSGPIDWRGLDHRVGSLAERGAAVLPQLIGSPGREGPPTAGELPEWARFVHAAVARYGAGGTFWQGFSAEHPDLAPRPPEVWQVWNEQNNRRFWNPEPSPEAYAKLLHASAAAIRAADPRAEVMLGGMYEYAAGMSATVFLRELYAISGAGDDFDIAAVHPYARGNAGIASQIEEVRDLLNLFGEHGKDIWITELGWSSVPIDESAGGVYAELSRDEAGQAEALEAAYEMLHANRSRWRLRGVVWYSWRDAAEPVCIFCQHTGLLRIDGSPKPSLAAFAGLALSAAPHEVPIDLDAGPIRVMATTPEPPGSCR